MSEGAPRRRLEGIVCPTCHSHFDLIRILGRHGGNYKLLVRCPSCNVYGIGTAQAQCLDDPSAVAAAVEADPRHAPSRALEPISERDVVAMREFLRTFDGDFGALWAKE